MNFLEKYWSEEKWFVFRCGGVWTALIILLFSGWHLLDWGLLAIQEREVYFSSESQYQQLEQQEKDLIAKTKKTENLLQQLSSRLAPSDFEGQELRKLAESSGFQVNVFSIEASENGFARLKLQGKTDWTKWGKLLEGLQQKFPWVYIESFQIAPKGRSIKVNRLLLKWKEQK